MAEVTREEFEDLSNKVNKILELFMKDAIKDGSFNEKPKEENPWQESESEEKDKEDASQRAESVRKAGSVKIESSV